MMRSFKFLIKAIVFLLFTGSLYAQNAPDITKLEYYIDIDPGYGLGSQIPITPDSAVNIFDVIDLSTTAPGFHILGVRAMDENGVWGITHTHRFHVTDKSFLEPLSNLVEVEYFFNTDDGYGQGLNLAITSDSMLHITPLIDLSTVNPGINLMGIRAKDAEGHWGVTHTHLFHLTETSIEEPLLDIIEVEYFLNTDAGFGQGQSISVTPDSLLHITPLIDLSAATPGFNLLGVRAKDSGGHWGATHTHRFHVDDVMHAPLANIVEIEYFFNAPDPGMGLGFTIPTTIDNHIDTALIIDLTGLAIGPHFMGIRAKDDEGSYSHTYIHNFDVVLPPDTFDFTGGNSYCAGQAGITATLSASESNVFYVIYKDALPFDTINGTGNPLIWSNLNNGIYNVVGYIIGASHIYTYMNGVLTVVENPLPIVNCPTDFDVCMSVDSLALLGATPIGGTYSGIGVSNGYFYPAQLTADDYDITYVYQDLNGCIDSCIFTITVNALPLVDCPIYFEICIHIDSAELIGSLPVGGIYSGTGVSGGYFFPQVAGLGTHSITYSYSDLNTCTNTCQFNITVLPLPVLDCPTDTAVCAHVDSVLLAGALPVGGTYSGTYVSNGYFLPQQAGTGQHSITYTYADLNYCINSCTYVITVNDLPSVTCPADFVVCVNSDSVLLTGASPSGGTYSGAGVSGDYFLPWIAGAGNHIISYTYADTHGCENVCTFEILVHDVPVLNCGPDLDVCINADTFMLISSMLPPGGTYSGTAVNNNYFNPALAGIGSHTIMYEYTDTNSCLVFCMFDINVHGLPQITVSSNSPVCQGETISLTAGGGTTYEWSGPQGFSHVGATVTITNADIPIAGDYTVVVTGSYNCSADTTVSVVVNTLPSVTVTASVTSVCSGQTTLLTATGSADVAAYAWSTGAATAEITVTPVVSSSVYTVTVSTAQNCSNTADINIVVNNNPAVELTGTPESCEDKADGRIDVAITNPTVQPYNYLWYYGTNPLDSGVTDVTAFYLSNAASGDYTLMLEDAFGCSATANYFLEPSTVSCNKGALVPDIFSPNGDGINDILFVYGQYIKSIEFFVYSRWGKKIFESTDINLGWDGKFNGTDAPQGVYPYYLKVIFMDDTIEEMSGDVTLVR